jgi:hypothetical protein
VLFTQLVAKEFPVSLRLTFMVHPGAVCRVIWFSALDITLTASITSTSPFVGQFEGSVSQSAGQVAQPIGVCITSKMNSPSEYCFLDSIRTENRPVEALGTVSLLTVVSTLKMADEEDA